LIDQEKGIKQKRVDRNIQRPIKLSSPAESYISQRISPILSSLEKSLKRIEQLKDSNKDYKDPIENCIGALSNIKGVIRRSKTLALVAPECDCEPSNSLQCLGEKLAELYGDSVRIVIDAPGSLIISEENVYLTLKNLLGYSISRAKNVALHITSARLADKLYRLRLTVSLQGVSFNSSKSQELDVAIIHARNLGSHIQIDSNFKNGMSFYFDVLIKNRSRNFHLV
jgi:hypothetical protein